MTRSSAGSAKNGGSSQLRVTARRLHVLVDADLHLALGRLAAQERTSMAAIVRRALRAHLPPMGPLAADPVDVMIGMDDHEAAPLLGGGRLSVIFVDTSYWLALRTRRDHLNEEAMWLLSAWDRETLVTTTLVVGETFAELARRTNSLRVTRAFAFNAAYEVAGFAVLRD